MRGRIFPVSLQSKVKSHRIGPACISTGRSLSLLNNFLQRRARVGQSGEDEASECLGLGKRRHSFSQALSIIGIVHLLNSL